jgi:hypothetical protein
MPPHPFMPWQQFTIDPLADKRADLFYKDQEIGKLSRMLANTLEMLDDVDLSPDLRSELQYKICDLTSAKASLIAERDKMGNEFHVAEQKMLSERTSRHREEDFRGDREIKMQKSDGLRGGHSTRGGRGGGRFY